MSPSQAWILLGTCMTWFLLDIAFYSQNLFLPDLLRTTGFSKFPKLPPGGAVACKGECAEAIYDGIFRSAVGNAVVALIGKRERKRAARVALCLEAMRQGNERRAGSGRVGDKKKARGSHERTRAPLSSKRFRAARAHNHSRPARLGPPPAPPRLTARSTLERTAHKKKGLTALIVCPALSSSQRPSPATGSPSPLSTGGAASPFNSWASS